MKFLVVAFVLALAASASAGVFKTIEEIEDRVNNDNNEDALALTGVNVILHESQDRITDGHNVNVSPSDGTYETSEESKDHITNGNNADDTALTGVYETRDENKDPTTNYYNADASTSAGVNETFEKFEGRITNGQTAYAGQLPYQAFLDIRNYNSMSRCGGSLIGSEWVLTAAHCTINAQSVTVYLGSIQSYYGTSRTVSRQNIIIHHAYNSHRNDISLIKIPAVSLNSTYIQPIKLPAISNYYSSYAGENVIASGWGQTSDSNSPGSVYLQWARLRVITNSECNASFGFIASSHICVSTKGGVSTCFGDSGGPMVLESSKVLIGLTSFGQRTCQSGYPTAFTRVTSHLDWIKYYTGIYYV